MACLPVLALDSHLLLAAHLHGIKKQVCNVRLELVLKLVEVPLETRILQKESSRVSSFVSWNRQSPQRVW